VYDPRLTFLAHAEQGLTTAAIRTRMEITFGIDRELAEALIDLAEKAGYLQRKGDVLKPVGDVSVGRARKAMVGSATRGGGQEKPTTDGVRPRLCFSRNMAKTKI